VLIAPSRVPNFSAKNPPSVKPEPRPWSPSGATIRAMHASLDIAQIVAVVVGEMTRPYVALIEKLAAEGRLSDAEMETLNAVIRRAPIGAWGRNTQALRGHGRGVKYKP
jgi:hypothetical protein